MKKNIVSNIITGLLIVFALILVFSPDAKGWMIQNLMKIGLFQPEVPSKVVTEQSDLTNGTAVLFKDANGKVIDLTSLKGKVVFINFWATWCPPCIAEMPSINGLYKKYKDNTSVVFIMADVDGTINSSTAFMKKKGYVLPVHIPASSMPREYFSGSMPTTIILDKQGRLSFNHVGGADYSNPEVAAFIDKLLKMNL
ncbi:TlpA disulfide reductase family protein [Pedobacter frigoris]|uniref:TlpA family protein disulfide reductase n=1 Tax=Pedobacter frigoris TaxID=2571272 RepID=UPI00292DA221|nr:TlpA disulfide reductase family protein [Pedobacter frigoris]